MGGLPPPHTPLFKALRAVWRQLATVWRQPAHLPFLSTSLLIFFTSCFALRDFFAADFSANATFFHLRQIFFPLSFPPGIFFQIFPNFFSIFFPTFSSNFAILRKNWSIFKIAQIELGVLLANAQPRCDFFGTIFIEIRWNLTYFMSGQSFDGSTQ